MVLDYGISVHDERDRHFCLVRISERSPKACLGATAVLRGLVCSLRAGVLKLALVRPETRCVGLRAGVRGVS